MTIHTRLPDYYNLLGVKKDASFDEIRQAFRRQAKQFHPDLNRSWDARNEFLVLSDAYYVLRDRERRESFDACRLSEARERMRTSRSRGWATGVVFASLVGMAGFVLANVETTAPISRNDANDGGTPTASADALAVPSAIAVQPLVATADDAPNRSSRDDWQATASPAQMPLVTAPDILDDDEVPAASLAQAAPAPSARHEEVAALQMPAAKPAAAKPGAAIMPRIRAAVVRHVRHARAYAAAPASKVWTTKKRRHMAARGAKRHVSSL